KKLRALHSKVAGPLADLTACRRAGSTRISHHATPSDSNLPLRLTDLASPSQAHQLGHAASHRDPAPSREPSIQSPPKPPPPTLRAPARRRRRRRAGDGVHRRARRGDAEALQVQRPGPLGGGQVRAPALLEPLRHPLPALDAITLMGFMFLLTSSLLSYIYSPHLDTAPPRWVHLAHGILLFLYQTFDAVDGKQARRTSSSSPLGELFDHGCDALACAFEALALGSTLMCGRLTFCYWVVAAVPFYLATWEHYFTNTLILPVINGPTEGLMLIYVSHLFTFFTGAEWWAQDFRKSLPLISLVPLPFVPEIPLYVIVLILMIMFAVIPTVGSNIGNVQKVVDARKGSMELALAMLLPFIALLAGVAVWCYLSPSDIMKNQPHLLVIGTGSAFGYLVGRMILAHLCDEPKGLKTGMCMALVFLPFAIANALTAKINNGTPLADELLVILLYCATSVGLYMHLAISVCHEIKDALGIYCFRIARKEA
uniref:Aminoalcoholphosphotransferase n=1 Tax=Aegilops tauschii subsp. strangulata TaxID=200361 RepID=A0A453R2D5_AEGTS